MADNQGVEIDVPEVLRAALHHVQSDGALDRKKIAHALNVALVALKHLPVFREYQDDDECHGETIEEYVRDRIGPEPADEMLRPGSDFYVEAFFARTERWLLVSGPTADDPDATVVCSQLEAQVRG